MANQSTGGSQSGSSSSDKRYSLDCREAGQGCSLSISGTFEEVLAEGVEHGKRVHGMSGDKIEEDVKGFIKEDVSGSSGGFTGRSGSGEQGRRPHLPS